MGRGTLALLSRRYLKVCQRDIPGVRVAGGAPSSILGAKTDLRRRPGKGKERHGWGRKRKLNRGNGQEERLNRCGINSLQVLVNVICSSTVG